MTRVTPTTRLVASLLYPDEELLDFAGPDEVFTTASRVAQRRYIDQGRPVSSAGISAGIDMSLHLVERLAGAALAERTARQMDVVWTRDLG